MTGFLLSEVSVKFCFFRICLGFSCYVHRIADSIQTSNVETSQRMQPLNPGRWFGDRGLKDPNACKKALTMQILQMLRSCIVVLVWRNLTAKFDGDIFGEVFRRKPPAK